MLALSFIHLRGLLDRVHFSEVITERGVTVPSEKTAIYSFNDLLDYIKVSHKLCHVRNGLSSLTR